MKRIYTGFAADPSPQQPLTTKGLDFLQDANKEMIQAICQNFIASNGYVYSSTVPYLITSNTSNYYFFNGELYLNIGTAVSAYFHIDNTPDGTADPLLFTDFINRNVHNDRYLYSDGINSSVLFLASAIVDVSPVSVTNITLLNSWLVYSTQNPAYKKNNNNVFFQGSITKTGINTGTIFTLPVNVRPSVDRHVICADAQAYTLNVLSISASTGNVSLIVSSSGSLIYLDGISYAL